MPLLTTAARPPLTRPSPHAHRRRPARRRQGHPDEDRAAQGAPPARRPAADRARARRAGALAPERTVVVVGQAPTATRRGRRSPDAPHSPSRTGSSAPATRCSRPRRARRFRRRRARALRRQPLVRPGPSRAGRRRTPEARRWPCSGSSPTIRCYGRVLTGDGGSHGSSSTRTRRRASAPAGCATPASDRRRRSTAVRAAGRGAARQCQGRILPDRDRRPRHRRRRPHGAWSPAPSRGSRNQLARRARRRRGRLPGAPRAGAMDGRRDADRPATSGSRSTPSRPRRRRSSPNVVFGPGVTVGSGATIHAFCHLEGCHVSRGASVGPFARLRPGAVLGRGRPGRQLRRGQERHPRRGRQGQPPDLYRRRRRRRRRQHRRRHHHLQLRRRLQAPHRDRRARLRRLEHRAGRAGHGRRRRASSPPAA